MRRSAGGASAGSICVIQYMQFHQEDIEPNLIFFLGAGQHVFLPFSVDRVVCSFFLCELLYICVRGVCVSSRRTHDVARFVDVHWRLIVKGLVRSLLVVKVKPCADGGSCLLEIFR